MNFKYSSDWIKSFLIMLCAVTVMGMCVSLLVMCNMGTDPYSAMNYGISHMIGMSFGNYQLLSNLVLLLVVIIFDRKLIGTGTLGNMILVGYAADFFTWIWKNVCHVPEQLSLSTRIMILIPALILFVFAAAIYMQSGHGTAPYDAVSFLITNKIAKVTGRNMFRIIRIVYDLLATCIATETGGEVGIITILMVILLGPTVGFVGDFIKRKKPKMTTL